MNLTIKKVALGSVAALTIAGGALTSCKNKPEVTKEATETTTKLEETNTTVLEVFDAALETAKEKFAKARELEIADSTEFVNNPNRNTFDRYMQSKEKSNLDRLTISFLENEKAKQAAEEAKIDVAIKAYADSLKNNVQ